MIHDSMQWLIINIIGTRILGIRERRARAAPPPSPPPRSEAALLCRWFSSSSSVHRKIHHNLQNHKNRQKYRNLTVSNHHYHQLFFVFVFWPEFHFFSEIVQIFCHHHDWTAKRQHFCVDPVARRASGRPPGPIFGPKICIFLRYAYITPIFLGRTDPTQWDHKSPISWGNSG